MKITDTIIAGIAATTAFSLFSYLASYAADEKFQEPELIGEMANRLPNDLSENQARFAGWLSHYILGIGFASAYQQLVSVTNIKPSIGNGVIAGALSGFPASLAWDNAFKMHPLAPNKRTLPYYFQLVVGHALFGAVCMGVLQVLNKKHDQRQATEPIPSGTPESKMVDFATAGS